MSPRRFYSPSQIAHIFDVSVGTVRRWIADDRLPNHRVPGTRRMRVADADMRDFARCNGIPIDVPKLPVQPNGA